MTRIALFGVDPGGKSGVTWGYFNGDADSVRSAFRRARQRGSLHGVELSGTAHAQAWWIAEHWREFYFHATVELHVPTDNIDLVIEDFELRQRNVELAPVEVIHGILTLLQIGRSTDERTIRTDKKTDEYFRKLETRTQGYPYKEPVFQKASTAKSFATNKRLREWDAWVVGSEHIRDAMRHLGARLNALI
jgi:hypothetical protein